MGYGEGRMPRVTRSRRSLLTLLLALAMTDGFAQAAETPLEDDDPEEAAPLPRRREHKGPPDATLANAPRRWQFGISLNLINYQHADFTVSPLNSGRTFDGTMDRTSYGPSVSSVTLEPGYAASDRLIVGLLLDIGYRVTSLSVPAFPYDVEVTSGSFAVGPRVLYFFTDPRALRPYAMLAGGYTTTPGKETEQSIKLTEYQAFAGLGAHWFLDPAFSLDLSVRGAYGIGSGSLSNPPLEHAALEGTFYTVMWNLGTSGWLH